MIIGPSCTTDSHSQLEFMLPNNRTQHPFRERRHEELPA
jgi:hypothetical protein